MRLFGKVKVSSFRKVRGHHKCPICNPDNPNKGTARMRLKTNLRRELLNVS